MIIKDQNNKWLVPSNYTIDYNPDKNYNEHMGEEYLPPYRSDFKSVYEGIEIEMHIVNHCNLNCNCCNHFSPLADSWFITLEDFVNQITELKNNIPNIKTFLILGGEPALHPNLLEICIKAREILGPTVYIEVLSNGTIIHKIAENKDIYLQYNINFTFTSYYNKTKIDEIKTLKPLGRIFNTRILSRQTLVEPNGSIDGHYNFFNCLNHKLPCFTLKDYKLFICPFSAHIDIYCKKANEKIPLIKDNDYLVISEIKNNLDKIQTFCFSPKHICNYCMPSPSVPFMESDKSIAEFETPINILYFKDYKKYEKIINAGSNGLIQWATNKDLNPGRVDTNYETHNLETELLRYKTGKIDLIIPYYNENISQLYQLKENLLKQTIINECAIYLISDNSKMDLGVFKTFAGYKTLHCTFLRNEENTGPGGVRNKGIQNSYNKYILFLDADCSFIKNTALEEIYEKMENANLDLLSWINYSSTKNKNQQGFCVNRQLIKNNNLYYKNIRFGEDFEYYIRLSCAVNKNKFLNLQNNKNIFIEYNTTAMSNNITSTFINYDKTHFSLFTSGFLGLMEANIDNENYIEHEKVFLNHIIKLVQEHNFLTKDTFTRSLIWFELYKLQNKHTQIILLNEYQSILKLFNLENINAQDYDLIKNFLIDQISLNYVKNNKLKENINYLMNYLKE